MEKKRIALKIPNTYSFITGNDFGRKVYEEQIRNSYSAGEECTIVFPNTVEGVSISFTQGLISEIASQIGKDEILRTITFEASTEYLVDKIRRDIIF